MYGLDVLDAACGHHAGWPEAKVLSDWGPYAANYAGRHFVKSDIRELPFKDKEFDFVIASHVLEHLPDVEKAIVELNRVAKAGYIETPAPLFDNLVKGNEGKHVSWVTFDDWNQTLIFRPRTKIHKPRMPVETWTHYRTNFPESAVTCVLWAGEIKFDKRF